MGFLSFIKGLTKGSNKISIDASLGNVLIAGNSKRGAEAIIRNYAIDSLNRDYGIVIFRDYETGISSYSSITSSSSMICEIDCTGNRVTERIDVFSGMSDSDVNSYIIKFFDAYNEIDKTKKMSFLNYISILRSLAKKAGRQVKLNNLSDYPIEELDNLNLTYCSGVEQSRNDRFLSSIRTEIRELEGYFFDFSNNIAGNILSGEKSLEQLFKLQPIIEVSLDFSRRAEASNIIMSAIIDAIWRFNLSASNVKSINIIVDGAPNDILSASGIQKLIKSGRDFNVLYTIQDISNLIEQSNEWVDYADSYFFFKQNSNNNKEFCSKFFGEYERMKETITTGVSNSSFWDRINGRGSSSENSGRSLTTEKERIYLPEVFARLPENQAIYYFKKSNEHNYLSVF